MKVFLYALLVLGSYLASAWLWMLMVGIAHHVWWQVIPPISYAGAMQMVLVPCAAAIVSGVVKGVVGADR